MRAEESLENMPKINDYQRIIVKVFNHGEKFIFSLPSYRYTNYTSYNLKTRMEK